MRRKKSIRRQKSIRKLKIIKRQKSKWKNMVQIDGSKKTVPKRRVEIGELKYMGLNRRVKVDGSK